MRQTMRKVMVSEYKWSAEAKRNLVKDKCEAIFHQFGVDYEEFEGGPGSYSTAIVELSDGTVHNVHVSLIRFLDT